MLSRSTLTFFLVLAIIVVGIPFVSAQEQNVGILRVAAVKYPGQVAPSMQFQLTIEVEYAIRFNATIKSVLFEGPPHNLVREIWHSDPVAATGGGDKVWTVNLTSPTTEQDWLLTVFAYYQEGGKWKYFNDTDQGPGYTQITLKVARLANLEIDLGVPDVAVTVDNSSKTTSSSGSLTLQVPVGEDQELTVPRNLELKNATRLVFLGWKDNVNETHRTVRVDGDTKLVGYYRVQYLLKVESIISIYRSSTWYDAGSNITLKADRTVPLNGSYEIFGLHYIFKGWSGQVNSTSTAINVTMNEPKVISANYAVDYTPLVVPSIITVGIAGAIVLAILRRRGAKATQVEEEVAAQEVAMKNCENCGEPVEEGWTHCANCGKTLGSSEPPQG